MANRVVLAYSGGLDTSVAVRWMIENMGVEVVCLSADVGQEGTLEGNREKALGAGAIAHEELDLREGVRFGLPGTGDQGERPL
ncbi:MAG: argininosuccinate synthase [Microthrixaceae bacterium]